MISFSSTDSAPLKISVTLTAPAVYLDHSVITDLATEQSEHGRRFHEILQVADGTLCLSWAHVIELFALGEGPTFESVADYLKALGRRFAIIEADPGVVVERERRWTPGQGHPAVDEDFTRLMKNWDGMTDISFGILLDLMVDEDRFFEQVKELHIGQKSNLKDLFDRQREQYRTDRKVKQRLDAANYECSPRNFITEKVMLELLRESVRTNERFNLSDGFDYFHAVVSLACCTHVVFDRKWARRCGKIDLPDGSAKVFNGTQIAELLDSLESFHGRS